MENKMRHRAFRGGLISYSLWNPFMFRKSISKLNTSRNDPPIPFACLRGDLCLKSSKDNHPGTRDASDDAGGLDSQTLCTCTMSRDISFWIYVQEQPKRIGFFWK